VATSKREVPPLVSSDWLANNMNNPRLLIIDIRSFEDYLKGHVPRAVNASFALPISAWTALRNGLLLEVPPAECLFNAMSSIGVRDGSIIVVVGGTGNPRLVADAARVATTLLYAGIKNVAILDGGYEKWAREGRPVSTDITTPQPTLYRGVLNEAMFVAKEYVLSKVILKDREVVIVDARTPEVYFGVEVEPWAPVPGHIPGAKNLPAPWLLNKDWTFKSLDVLSAMASSIVGDDRSREIIVYCGIGGYASLLWYVLHEMLGYANVKIFDGAWQEWVGREPRGPVAVYVWE